MRRSLFTLALAGALCPAALTAQAAGSAPTASNPFVSAALQMNQRYGHNLTAAAQEMPADKYDFKPTPQQMSFAHLMNHIAGSNVLLCEHLSGMSAPADLKAPGDSAGKDALAAAVQKSFDFCGQALQKTDGANMSEEIPFFGNRKAPRATVLMDLVGDWFDHYSAAAMYLRLNGHLPPTAQHRM